jgi:hypothetical protein
MSRRKTLPSFNSSRQMMTAWNVSGLSHRPAIMASWPASMRLAMAVSPSLESSTIDRISRRYMRTGSSVRSAGSLAPDLAGGFDVTATISLPSPSSSFSSPAASRGSFGSASASSVSTTLIPSSLSIDRMSSLVSEVASSKCMAVFICS